MCNQYLILCAFFCVEFMMCQFQKLLYFFLFGIHSFIYVVSFVRLSD